MFLIDGASGKKSSWLMMAILITRLQIILNQVPQANFYNAAPKIEREMKWKLEKIKKKERQKWESKKRLIFH